MNILELLIEVMLLLVLIKVSKLAKGSPDSSIWLGPCVVGDVGFLMLINKFWIHPLWVSPVLCLLHGISAIPLWVCSYLAAFHPWNRWERPRHDHFLMPGGHLIWCQVQPWLPSLRHLHFSVSWRNNVFSHFQAICWEPPSPCCWSRKTLDTPKSFKTQFESHSPQSLLDCAVNL